MVKKSEVKLKPYDIKLKQKKKGVPIEELKKLNIGQIKKLTKQFK